MDPQFELAIQDLSLSPMHNFSLGDKELFHSNFLRWISSAESQLFEKVIEDLSGVKLSSSRPHYSVQREYHQMDLVILDKNEKPLLVIENKMKQFPSKYQLDGYKSYVSRKNSGCTFCLLTLMEDFPNKQGIINSGWKLTTYKMLVESLSSHIRLVNEEYHKYIIVDYIKFVSSLLIITEKWLNMEINDCVSDEFRASMNSSINLTDFCEKIRVCGLCCKLIGELKKAGYSILPHEMSDADFMKQNQRTLLVNWGFTSTSRALLEVKVKAKNCNDHFIIIQIQRGHYMYGSCWDSKYFPTSSDVIAKNPPALSQEISSMLRGQKPLGTNAKRGGYCKYEKQFDGSHHMIYRWVIAPQTNKEIIDKLMSDMDFIMDNLA